MSRNYEARLDRIEEIITPERGAPHLVWLNAGETDDQAVTAYAMARGLTIAEGQANMIGFKWADATLSPLPKTETQRVN